VTRARLFAPAGEAARILLVSAPAGSGKTVFLLDWLAAGRTRFAWLSLDALDNDFARFRTHLAAALRASSEPSCAAAAAAVEALRAGDGADALGGVLAAFESIDPAVVLVLDDLHTIDAPAVLGVLTALLTKTTHGPRYALLSRRDPPLPLARLRLAGELHEVREADLRFTLAEARALYDVLLPGTVDDALLARLSAKTEGWAAGLRLAAIALARTPGPAAAAAAVESFAGTSRIVVDYLVEEAVCAQEPALQWFLHATSILPRLTADACVAVLDDPGAAALLAEAEARNLFLVALGSGWYRYHHLFAELLEFRLRRLHPEQVDALHQRASEWFAGQGEVQEALRHASRTRDRSMLLRLLDEHGLAMCGRSELASFGRWARLVADPLEHPQPGFLAALTWYRMLTEKNPDLAPLITAARAALAAAQGQAGADAARWREIGLQLDACDAFRLRLGGHLREAVIQSDHALELLPADAVFTRGLLLYNAGAARAALADGGALAMLERSFETNLHGGAPYLVLSSLALATSVIAQAEGVARARSRLDASVPVLRSLEIEQLPAAANLFCQRGWLAWLGDDLASAEAHLRDALRLAAGSVVEAEAIAHVLLARTLAAAGRAAEADAHMAEALALARSQTVTLTGTTLPLEVARLDLLLGRDAGAPSNRTAVSEEWSAARETALVLELLRWLRLGDTAVPDVRSIAETLASRSRENGRGLADLLAQTCLALLQPEPRARWAAVDTLLAFAGESGYLGPLLEGGIRMQRLAAAALGQPLSDAARETARVLVERFASRDIGEPVTAATGALLVPLTSRELAVLECLVRGSSNKAIARTMFVSIDTVKTHLRHIYDKLGVVDRRQAVLRAGELGLVSPA
jgi:LuxR family transcriptional regulator, maltose regulon positive regulatory protein